MSGVVLFHMWEQVRQSLIEGHLFYVEQAKKRLLSQFNNIEAEADKAVEEWLERSNEWFDPDRHDPGDFYEVASDAGIEFYSLLSDMRDQTRLGVVAGMFHEWDKKLRDWLVREIQHWHRGDNVARKVWSADFEQITELLAAIGWEVRCADYFSRLDACRLVVNVHKHGKGKSLDELKRKYPEYFDDKLSKLWGEEHLDHTDITLNEDQIQSFSDAIIRFWRDVPERIFNSDGTSVPDWLEKAFLKDCSSLQQVNSP